MYDNEPTGPTAAAGGRGEALSNAEIGIARRLPTVSPELLPPRPGKTAPITWGRIGRLLATGPDFISVIYQPTSVTDPAGGVTGSGRQGSTHGPKTSRRKIAPRVHTVQKQTNPSEYVLAHVLDSSAIPFMAHLTCIGYREREAVDIVTRFLCMGARHFLALRGDPPAGTWAGDVAGELRHTDGLVRVVREVGADFFGDGRYHVTIAATAYSATNDHVKAIEVLATRRVAGVDMAITQVFYNAADYVALISAVSYAEVSTPILPGMIPLTDLYRLARLKTLTGARISVGLRSSPGPASGATLVKRDVGVTLDLATALLRVGAPGLHLYTFNRIRLALDVISRLRPDGILAGVVPDQEVRDVVDRGCFQVISGQDPSFLRRGSARATVSSHHPIQSLTTTTKEST